MAGLKPVNNTITLPKFKFSYDNTLNNALTDLGLGIAFSDNANFSLINNGVPLKIGQVVHKAFVETDESGTTAAAATSVGIVALVGKGIPAGYQPSFIFAIREMGSGLILFAGYMLITRF